MLEVKSRARATARARWRSVGWALAVTVGVTVAVYCGARGWEWLRREVITDNALFALETVEVQADGRWLNPELVQRWAGIRRGDNLLTIDLARLKRDLELVPQIESASVERVLPGLLRLRVTEREPVAQVQGWAADAAGRVAAAVYYLDAGGVVMPAWTADPAGQGREASLAELPVVRGLSPAQLRVGHRLDLPEVRAALDLLVEFGRSPMAGLTELKLVDLTLPEVLEVWTSDGTHVTFARTHLQRQLGRWRLIQAAGAQRAKRVAALDLSLTNNCPVVWAEAPEAPEARPRPNPPLKGPKKNV